ncbi:hypothetical protein JTE90_013062 [Oedothorax gibbosus]|uniref:Uncharacterized protein n=1 Tax=Oedothorax gibbosus TaxID=931172 RepID=A0AAV6TIQ4_9ARAC|nr:hypothetical protein JTE90_013062 [Oedothorax gibbosus]
MKSVNLYIFLLINCSTRRALPGLARWGLAGWGLFLGFGGGPVWPLLAVVVVWWFVLVAGGALAFGGARIFRILLTFGFFLLTHLNTGVSSWMAGGGAGLWCLCPGAGVLRWGLLLVLSPSPGVGCLFASLVVGAQLLGWDRGCHRVLILGLVPP